MLPSPLSEVRAEAAQRRAEQRADVAAVADLAADQAAGDGAQRRRADVLGRAEHALEPRAAAAVAGAAVVGAGEPPAFAAVAGRR